MKPKIRSAVRLVATLFVVVVLVGLMRGQSSAFRGASNFPSILQARHKMVLPIDTMLEEKSQYAKSHTHVEDHVTAAKSLAQSQSLLEARPWDSKILSEVKQDVHRVPESLLDFSVLVAGKMKEARKSFVYADALFAEFESCAVQGEEGKQNLAVRAYCLANAKRLVGWYPDLLAKWEQLSNQVGTHLLELVDLSAG